MNWLELALWGCVGGLIIEFAAVMEHRRTPAATRPEWLTSKLYWSVGLIMVVLGGLSASGFVPHGVATDWMLPLQVGMAAPALLNIGSRAVDSGTGVGQAD